LSYAGFFRRKTARSYPFFLIWDAVGELMWDKGSAQTPQAIDGDYHLGV